MPAWAWITVWVVGIAVVALLYVRERRSGRSTPEVDRLQTDAQREAEVRSHINGPNVRGQSWLG